MTRLLCGRADLVAVRSALGAGASRPRCSSPALRWRSRGVTSLRPAGDWLVGTDYGEETPHRPCGPPLLRALATLIEGGVRMTWLLCGCKEFRSCDGLLF